MTDSIDPHFAEDAREHLDQLERLLAVPGAPNPEQLVVLAGAVLTSARRAGAETVAAVAGRIEDAARSILTGNIAWSEELRALSSRTVEDIKLLLRAIHRWGPEEERRVRTAIDRWDEREGGAAAVASPEPVPIESLFYDDAGPHVVEAGDEPVPIEGLLLRGGDALRAAMALRPELESIAHGDGMPERPLADLVSELFDLLELAGSADPSADPSVE